MIILIVILIIIAIYERQQRYENQWLLQDTIHAFIDDRLTIEGNAQDGYSITIEPTEL